MIIKINYGIAYYLSYLIIVVSYLQYITINYSSCFSGSEISRISFTESHLALALFDSISSGCGRISLLKTSLNEFWKNEDLSYNLGVLKSIYLSFTSSAIST